MNLSSHGADECWMVLIDGGRLGREVEWPAPGRGLRPFRLLRADRPQSPGAWLLALCGDGLQGRQIAHGHYGGHGFSGEHAAALHLPVLMLLQ